MKQLIILCMVVACLTANTASAQSSLRISPTSSNISAQPGSTQRVRITLQNPTNKYISVKVIARDFEASPEQNGEPQFLTSNTSPYSLANWLSDSNLNKQITVPANQSIDYEAVFRVPFSIMPRTHYGSVTFVQDSGISVGSLVFITVGSPGTKYVIEDFKFSESEDATKPHGIFTATVSNISESFVMPTFVLKATNESGETVANIEDKEQGSVLPNSKRKYELIPSKKLPEAVLTATITTTDQNGVMSDKSIQLDRKPATTQPVQEKQINPDDYTWIPPATVAGVSVVVLVMYFMIRKSARNEN